LKQVFFNGVEVLMRNYIYREEPIVVRNCPGYKPEQTARA